MSWDLGWVFSFGLVCFLGFFIYVYRVPSLLSKRQWWLEFLFTELPGGKSGIWKIRIVFVSCVIICSCCLCFTWIPNPFSSAEDYEATDKRLWLQVRDKQLIKWMKEKKRLFQCKYSLLIRAREKNWEEMWLVVSLSVSIGFLFFPKENTLKFS